MTNDARLARMTSHAGKAGVIERSESCAAGAVICHSWLRVSYGNLKYVCFHYSHMNRVTSYF
jgi:hypothetical protein